jgi:predicted ribosomally synthesized peptide with SipW-like signal peptide
MKSIIKSLAIIIAVAAISGGATYAYFSDTATVSGNTFATGTLVIKTDEGSCFPVWIPNLWPTQGGHWDQQCSGATKFNVTKAEPGTCKTENVKIKNDGTLTARDLTVSFGTSTGDLCPALKGKINGTEYTGTPIPVGSSVTIDPNQSKDIPVEVCFPNDPHNSQNQYEDKSCTFEVKVDAKAYKPGGSEI